MRSSEAQSVVIPILSGALFITGTSGAQVITPIAQDRSVRTENLNAPQCNGDFLFDGDRHSSELTRSICAPRAPRRSSMRS